MRKWRPENTAFQTDFFAQSVTTEFEGLFRRRMSARLFLLPSLRFAVISVKKEVCQY